MLSFSSTFAQKKISLPLRPDYYFMSSGGYALIDSYRDLVARINTVDCKGGRDGLFTYHCTYDAMPSKCYNVGTMKDSSHYVTFNSYYYSANPTYDFYFRSGWTSSLQNAGNTVTGCIQCFPKPIVFPYPIDSAHSNDIFDVIFVPVDEYQKSKVAKDYLSINHLAIKPDDIKSINQVSIEATSGYIAKNEKKDYTSIYSSKGIICNITYKTGASVDCYVLNSYDGGTVMWKILKPGNRRVVMPKKLP